jgi:hypothetical protein
LWLWRRLLPWICGCRLSLLQHKRAQCVVQRLRVLLGQRGQNELEAAVCVTGATVKATPRQQKPQGYNALNARVNVSQPACIQSPTCPRPFGPSPQVAAGSTCTTPGTVLRRAAPHYAAASWPAHWWSRRTRAEQGRARSADATGDTGGESPVPDKGNGGD